MNFRELDAGVSLTQDTQMRPLMFYVHCAFTGIAEYELIKLENIEENLLSGSHSVIFPFVLFTLERCSLSLGLGRTRPHTGETRNKEKGMELGEAFQDTCINQIKGMIVVDVLPL